MNYCVRDILPEDNEQLKVVIQKTLTEQKCFESVNLTDPQRLKDLYSQYTQEEIRFWVVENRESNKIIGCAGYAPLESKICELQKMYLLPEARGCGAAKALLDKIIQGAGKEGFEKIYLETMPRLKPAIRFYKKNGFEILSRPVGNTGYVGCSVYMIKSI